MRMALTSLSLSRFLLRRQEENESFTSFSLESMLNISGYKVHSLTESLVHELCIAPRPRGTCVYIYPYFFICAIAAAAAAMLQMHVVWDALGKFSRSQNHMKKNDCLHQVSVPRFSNAYVSTAANLRKILGDAHFYSPCHRFDFAA